MINLSEILSDKFDCYCYMRWDEHSDAKILVIRGLEYKYRTVDELMDLVNRIDLYYFSDVIWG